MARRTSANGILLGGILAALFSFSAFAEDEAFRDFSDQNLRVIRAKILGTKGDQVDLVREDGKRFVFPIAKLSDEDQAFVREWKKPDSPIPEAGPSSGGTRGAAGKYYPRALGEIESELKRIKARDLATSGFDEENKKALAELNSFRFLSGLNSDVTLEKKYIEPAQAGAELCAVLGRLDHTPAKPDGMSDKDFKLGYEGTSNSNLHQGQGDLASAMHGWMHDAGENNKLEMGHRRWSLNPSLGKVGFGLAKGFAAMWSMDTSNSRPPDWETIAYPAPGYFPVGYFGKGVSWSVLLNPAEFRAPEKAEVRINIYPLGSGTAEADVTNRQAALEIDYTSLPGAKYGSGFPIIFLPKGVKLENRERYWVEITGVRSKNGGKRTIEYLVEFRDL